MALLSDAERTQLRDALDTLPRKVRLRLFTQTFGCETCHETHRLLKEIGELSPRVTVSENNLVLDLDLARQYRIERAPTTVVLALDAEGREVDYGVRFVGLPAGYEFGALIDAIALVADGNAGLSETSLAVLAALKEPVSIMVFTTPTCSFCPKAIDLAHRMAVASPLVTSFAVEVTEFPDLIQRYRVNGVPKTVVNDRNELLGVHPESEFITQALRGFLTEDQAES